MKELEQLADDPQPAEDAPEPADQEAGGTWSFTVGDDDGKGGPGASTHGMTWS